MCMDIIKTPKEALFMITLYIFSSEEPKPFFKEYAAILELQKVIFIRMTLFHAYALQTRRTLTGYFNVIRVFHFITKESMMFF